VKTKMIGIAAKTSLFYWFFASLYILTSDYWVGLFAKEGADWQQFQMFKGLGFVAITAILLYLGLHKQLQRYQQSEKALKQSEKKYRALFENMSEGFALHEIIIGEKGQPVDVRFLEMNAACERLTGWNRNKMIGRCVREVTHEPFWIERFGNVALTGKKEHFQYLSTHLKRWFEVFAYQPKPGQCAIIFTDITERKVLENASKENEQFLRFLIRSLPDLVWLKDQQGVYMACNSRFEKFFGATEKEIVGKTDYDFVPKELADHFKEKDQAAIAAGLPSTNEEEITFADDGHREILETIKTPMYDSEGALKGVLGIARDITQRKQTEETLQHQERLLQDIGSLAKVGGWEFDPASGKGTWTEEVARIHDLSPDSETSMEIGLGFYQSDSRRKIEKAIKAAIERGEAYDLELELVSAKGIHKWVRTIGKPKIENGDVINVRGSFQDITAGKMAEQRINHLNRVLKTLLDINHLVVRESDPEALIREGCRLLVENRGYSSALIVRTDKHHKPVSWGIAGRALSNKMLEKQLEEGELPPCFDLARNRKEMIEINDMLGFCGNCPVAVRGTETNSLCGRLVNGETCYGYIVVTMDEKISVDDEERRLFIELAGDLAYALNVIQSEEKNKSLENQLLQAQKMESVGRLAGGVAHDYNNMLSVILGYADLAMERVGPQDPLYEDLNEILIAGKRSEDITRQLLAFARQQTIAPKVLDLNQTVESMLKMLKRLIGEDLNISWNPNTQVWSVKMDPSQIDQLLANLCVNARDAITDVGEITIETGKTTFDEAYCADHAGFVPGDFVMLAVSDDGCGMDKETQEKIFEPFFTTKRVGKGTGLGLATVYGIVKQNDGFINVYSEPGKGTTFKVYLPRYQGLHSEDRKQVVEALPEGRNEWVLVVEDDPQTLRLAERMLGRLGYRILATAMPSEAVQLVEAHPDITLLITDVVMPEMNGRELYERIKKVSPNIRCLFMSGYTADVIAHRGVLEEGLAFIQKPFSKKDLAMKVRGVLDEKNENAVK